MAKEPKGDSFRFVRPLSTFVLALLVLLVLLMLQMHLPLCLCNAHQQILVLDGNPRGEHLHGVFKVGLEQDVAHAVDQGSRSGMQDVEGRAEGR